MTIASVAAQQSAASSASATSTATGTSTTQTSDPLGSLSGNLNNFLTLLMTQLKNQDPTSPLDTNAFTSELVQFSNVEQQVKTNTSLTQLIQLTQAGEIMQSSAMLGKEVSVTSDHIPLQNGSGTLQFTETSAQPVTVSIYSDAGAKIREDTIVAKKGQNTWTWNGTDSSGNTVADGSYKVAVTSADASGKAAAVPFTVLGTATGVQKQGNSMQLQLGTLGVDFSAVQSVGQ
jgi:flagellar basal-body rod modification protein FlgD